MIYIILIALAIAIPIVYLNSKRLKLPNVYLVTGGVKTGKSFYLLNLLLNNIERTYLWLQLNAFLSS